MSSVIGESLAAYEREIHDLRRAVERRDHTIRELTEQLARTEDESREVFDLLVKVLELAEYVFQALEIDEEALDKFWQAKADGIPADAAMVYIGDQIGAAFVESLGVPE